MRKSQQCTAKWIEINKKLESKVQHHQAAMEQQHAAFEVQMQQ